MARKIDIPEGRWFPGADTTFAIEVVDGAGLPEDMTDWELLFAVHNGRSPVACALEDHR